MVQVNKRKTILRKNTNHLAESLNTTVLNVTTVLKRQIVLFIASAKITEREGSISTFSFYWQLPYY